MPEFGTLKILLEKYFPDQVTDLQMTQFEQAFEGYLEWNDKINVISRKDIENLAERHFLHSLAIARAISFPAGSRVLDIGTGGGFPGIPLAIFFPEVNFVLCDSITKKIRVVENIAQVCGLENVQAIVQRAEQLPGPYDYFVSRAVASFEKFMPWVKGKYDCRTVLKPSRGVYYLRGGDAAEERKTLRKLGYPSSILPLKEAFEGEFFESKYIVQIPLCK